MNDIQAVLDFLPCRTPQAWIDAAIQDIPTLLVDHANCEKKAASTALGLMYRYTDNFELLNKMSRLAREELRHFEQVIAIMKKRGIEYRHLTPSRYAGELHKHIRKEEPDRLVDTLIVGAIIEARSCERFYSLIPHLDEDLAKFYESLLKSEARHFEDYLELAQKADRNDVTPNVNDLLAWEYRIFEVKDSELRFHSGVLNG
jgi:tRNA 2-(methylsulfanyl)-N6-isopentenyladenosine37 hydroxylase